MECNQSYYYVHNRYKWCAENEMLHLTCCSCTRVNNPVGVYLNNSITAYI